MTRAQTTSTTSKHSKRSSFIAKWTAPFVAKQRSHVEQEIRLDEPFRHYAPGDVIKGAIHLTFAKPMRITHLVVRLHGFVNVFGRAKLPGEEILYDESLLPSGSGTGSRGIEYFGNGFARLFEDEEVLCGEGRVLGQYAFRFEVVLPSKNIPSSIDFEHGTISYLITSTVTRPTAIAPTLVQHFKLHVQEVIDIAPIKKPKPVALSMDTSHKKGKPKLGAEKKSIPPMSSRTSKSSTRDSTSGLPTLRTVGSQSMENPPQSPVPSEISSTTATTNSTSSNSPYSREPLSYAVNKASENIMTISDPNIVSVKTEVLQGACLAGDNLPIKISIRHNKVIKSMQGIIVTLYRQGCIDTNPALPVGPFRKGDKRRYENYYLKSRTGLSGLSLSSAGSTRFFRQDLAQIVVPIIIDPQSLTAAINTSIEAPPHLFPSITNVPGAMVSFKYFVEIVVDLRGKLSGQDRIRPHLSMTSGPRHGYGDPKVSRWEGSDGINYHSAPAFNYLITDQLRRTRGTVSTRTEIVVGTRDNAKKRGKQPEARNKPSANSSPRESVVLGREEEGLVVDNVSDRDGSILDVRGRGRTRNNIDLREPTIVPPPEPEEHLDEKAQMRRAEQRVLPSAPPQEDQISSSMAPVPSAPSAISEEDLLHRYGLGAPAPAYDGPPVSVSGQHMAQSSPPAQNDKQELERQRLLALASSPQSDTNEAEGVEDAPQILVPSAPVLYQDDVFSLNDPRIPESSPADFADDQLTSEGPINPVEAPDPLPEESAPLNFTRAHEHVDHDDNELHETNLGEDEDIHNDTLPVYKQ